MGLATGSFRHPSVRGLFLGGGPERGLELDSDQPGEIGEILYTWMVSEKPPICTSSDTT